MCCAGSRCRVVGAAGRLRARGLQQRRAARALCRPTISTSLSGRTNGSGRGCCGFTTGTAPTNCRSTRACSGGGAAGQRAITGGRGWAAAELRGRYRVMITKVVEEAAPFWRRLRRTRSGPGKAHRRANDKYAKISLRQRGEAVRVQAAPGRTLQGLDGTLRRQEDRIERFVKEQLARRRCA